MSLRSSSYSSLPRVLDACYEAGTHSNCGSNILPHKHFIGMRSCSYPQSYPRYGSAAHPATFPSVVGRKGGGRLSPPARRSACCDAKQPGYSTGTGYPLTTDSAGRLLRPPGKLVQATDQFRSHHRPGWTPVGTRVPAVELGQPSQKAGTGASSECSPAPLKAREAMARGALGQVYQGPASVAAWVRVPGPSDFEFWGWLIANVANSHSSTLAASG